MGSQQIDLAGHGGLTIQCFDASNAFTSLCKCFPKVPSAPRQPGAAPRVATECLSAGWGEGKASSALSPGGQQPSRVSVLESAQHTWLGFVQPRWGLGSLCIDVPVVPSEAGPGGLAHLGKAPTQSSLSTKGHISSSPAGKWVPQHVLQDLASQHILLENLIPLESSQLSVPATAITPEPATSSELVGGRECTEMTPTSSSLTCSGRSSSDQNEGSSQSTSPAQLPAPPDHSKNPQGFSSSPLCCCGCENTLNK